MRLDFADQLASILIGLKLASGASCVEEVIFSGFEFSPIGKCLRFHRRQAEQYFYRMMRFPF